MDVAGELAFDTAAASAQYVLKARGVFLGNFDMVAKKRLWPPREAVRHARRRRL